MTTQAALDTLRAALQSEMSGYIAAGGVTYAALAVVGQWAYEPLAQTTLMMAAVGVAAAVATVDKALD